MSGIGLTPAQLAAIFPFHVGVGPDLRVIQVGPGWTRVSKAVRAGADLVECFRLVRPALPLDVQSLSSLEGTLVVLDCVENGLPLKAQLVPSVEPGGLLFLGSPWVRRLEDLERYGLSLDDWPPHESTADFLFLLRAKEVSLAEADDLAKRLTQRQSDLSAALTQLEQAQGVIKDREANLRAIFDAAAEGIVIADEQGIIQSFNAAASRLFGWAPEEIIGSNVSVLAPPPFREEHDGYLARYRHTAVPTIIGSGREVEGLRRDGTRFPLYLAVSEVQSPQGRTFTGILRDLTELKAAQHALETSEARVRLVIDAALDAVIGMDADGLVTLWNAQAEAIFGWSRGEAVGRPLVELVIPPSLRQGHVDGMRRYLTTGEARVLNRRIEITAAHRDGHEFPVELSITPLLEGGRVSFSGFVRDISDRKRSERLLRTQYEFSRILALGSELSQVAPLLLRTACEYLGWAVGALWTFDEEAGVLRCAEVWHEPGLGTTDFLAQTRAMRFRPGVGLPGRAFSAGEYAWVPVVTEDPNFPRASAAAAAGLASGIALPMSADGLVGGVLEFFSQTVTEPGIEEIKTLSNLAGQLGQFIERQRAEQAVRDGRERLALALEGGNLGSWDLDMTTGQASLDARYAAIIGYEPGELDAVNQDAWWAMVHPDDRPAVQPAFGTHIRGESQSYEAEFRMRHKNGGWVWVADSGRVTTRDGQGRALRVSGTIRDISARKESDEKLQQSQSRLRSVVDHMLEGLVVVDEKLCILEANSAFAETFGYPKDALVGMSVLPLMPDRPEYQDPASLYAAFRASVGKVTEHEGRRRSGEVFPLQLQVYPVMTPAGRLVAGHVRDLTVERESERLKKRFVASVSHELRTPLTAIRGSLGLLAKGAVGELPADATDVVLMAERNAVRLVGIINDLLDFERIQAGPLPLSCAAFQLDEAVGRAKESVDELARQSRIAILNPSSGVAVWGDQARIVQVLVNLLGNAIKFSPADSQVDVTVTGHAEFAEVRVRDRGRGVPDDLREVIFRPFRQVEESDARQHGGSGMGLAICRAIVTQHGGTIGVDSRPGEGAAFWFTIPRKLPSTP